MRMLPLAHPSVSHCIFAFFFRASPHHRMNSISLFQKGFETPWSLSLIRSVAPVASGHPRKFEAYPNGFCCLTVPLEPSLATGSTL